MKTNGLIEIEQLTVRGGYKEMGIEYGAHFQARIRAFIEMRLTSAEKYFKDWKRGSVDELKEVGRACWAEAQRFHPAGAREHLGIAQGAGVDPELLYTTTNMTDMRDVVLLPDVSPPSEDEGCTSALIPPQNAINSVGLFGQTWDLNPPDIEFIVALHRVPDDGLETWTITCTGCQTLVGMNEHGISVGTTNLKTWRSRVGVGYLSVLHKAVSQPTDNRVREVFQTAPVAGAHSYWYGSPEGGEEWERSPKGAYLRSTEEGPIGRSNHCLFEGHQEVEGIEPTESSRSRYQRVTELLNAEPHSVETLKALFSDRAQGIYSINRYPEDDQGTTTNAVAISDPASRTLYACRGPADRGAWVALNFERPAPTP